MAMRSHRLISSAAAACLLGVLAFSVASAQDGQPERAPQQGQPEGRPGGGNRPGVGRGEAPNVEASMKGMNRAIQQLRDQFNGAGEKEACLKLIGDAQRGCIGAKSGQPHHIRDIKDEAARGKAMESYRKQLMALARKLLDIEQNIMDGKNDAAKAQLAEVIKMRDKGHEEFGVKDE